MATISSKYRVLEGFSIQKPYSNGVRRYASDDADKNRPKANFELAIGVG